MTQSLRRRAVIILGGAVAIVLLAVFGLASGGRPRDMLAPELPRERLSGADATIPRLLAGTHGGGAIVVFWASWCGPCEREAPALERFALSNEGRGRIVGVDWSDQRSEALAFIKRYDWSFPNVRDAEGTVGLAYHLTGLPTSFVLDSRGRIAATLRGPQSVGSLTRALAGAS